jgi:NhaP-type Na+/H+ or K+/H+ antiporter
LYLSIFLLLRDGASVGQAIGKWIYLVILYQIILGTVIGVIFGVLARKGLKFAKRHQLIDRESMVAMSG